jgi:hypothetical protein
VTFDGRGWLLLPTLLTLALYRAQAPGGALPGGSDVQRRVLAHSVRCRTV